MRPTTMSCAAAAVALSIAATACGASSPHTNTQAQPAPAHATNAAAVQAPAVNQIDLASGSDRRRVSATIAAFYRATWNDQTSSACSLFSPAGSKGFLKAAKVAFPSSINPTTSCAQAMEFFHAGLADSVDTLQQSGVNVSGDILNHVKVNDVRISGTSAAAIAPEGVDVLIKPKRFLLVRDNGRWLIDGSQKVGKTLPQILAKAKAKGELRVKH